MKSHNSKVFGFIAEYYVARYKLSKRDTEGRLNELINDQCLQARRLQRRREQLLAMQRAADMREQAGRTSDAANNSMEKETDS